MPDFTQLKTFISVADLGSLAAAARTLQISAAAVSKQLTKLEIELGVQLLRRTTRQIELTQIGINYCLQCRRVLEEFEMASALISQIKLVPHGILKVVSGRHFATTYIVPFLKEFILKYPKIELNLELAERVPDLNNEEIDVVIGMSICATGDVIQKKIANTTYSFCASPGYFKQFGIPETPFDLKQHRYISHSMRKPDNELHFNDEMVVAMQPYIKINDAQTMLHLALDGMGIVKLHRYVVQEQLKRGSLQEVLASYNTMSIPIYVAYPNRRFIPSKVRCFVDFITEKMDQNIF